MFTATTPLSSPHAPLSSPHAPLSSPHAPLSSLRMQGSHDLQLQIQQLILKVFGFEVPTLVVSAEALQSIVNEIPSDWTNDDEWKTDVCFLWEEIDDKAIIKKLGYDPKIETVIYLPGAVVWHVSRDNQLKSKMVKVVGTKLYTQMTVRNINTARKLSALLD